MSQTFTIQLNGQPRAVETMEDAPMLDGVIAALGLKADRVAVELNGAIVRRADWGAAPVGDGDRLEIVHFVGGGSA